MTIKVLFVCLGNICRSPAAEAVLLHKIKERGIGEEFEVDSAGTGAWHVGNMADLRMQKAAELRGITLESRARQISLDDFSKFDFILTMDKINFSDVNAMAAKCANEIKASIKPLLSFSKQFTFEEVPDPYYGGENGFDEVLDLLEDAIDGFLNFALK